MSKPWGERDIPTARRHWSKIRLVCGGSPESVLTTCRAAHLKICSRGGGDMHCQCAHWLNLTVRQRHILIAARSGLPTGLIALLADDDAPSVIAVQIAVLQALAEIEPLKSHVERITELVPMWGERAAQPMERIANATGL